MDTKPLTLKERRDGFMRAAREFNSSPNAENWQTLKQWMLVRQAPTTMTYAQAKAAYREALDHDFDTTK